MNILVALGNFLESAVGPLAKRVLVSLGIGIISYASVGTIMEQAIDAAKGHYQGLPTAVLGLAGLAGFGEAFGIIAAAMIFRVTWNSQTKVLGVLNK